MRISRQSLSSFAVAFCSLALTACFNSEKSLFDPSHRVLPFNPPITIEVYNRKNPNEPWEKEKDRVTLVADDQLNVRSKDAATGDSYAFYPLEGGRYFVESRSSSSGRFTYGVLEIRNGEGLLHHMTCEGTDLAAFKAAGGTVTGVNFLECSLDKVANPLAFLTSMAAKPVGSQQKHVPVR